MATIGFIGAGNMGQALIKGIIAAGICQPENIFISDIRPARLKLMAEQYHVQPLQTNAELAAKVDTLVLSVKPQNMADVLAEIKSNVRKDALVISIAAGIKTAKIADFLGNVPIVRVMPNTPALVGQGAAALYANPAAADRLDTALKIFSAVGVAVVVDDEELMDAVTAVSGSGPAYFFLLMQEMIKAATELGLSADTAKQLVLQTAKGAALLAEQGSDSPAELRQKVTSPGGTTEAALKVFADNRFSRLVKSALIAAHNRSRQLSG